LILKFQGPWFACKIIKKYFSCSLTPFIQIYICIYLVLYINLVKLCTECKFYASPSTKIQRKPIIPELL
jgi:hypothetical protein